MTKGACAFLLVIALWTAPVPAANRGARAELIGGTVADLANGTSGHIIVTGEQAMIFQCKGISMEIPFERINTLEYGQRVGRRYAGAILVSPLLLLSKTRKHFVTVGYTDNDGKQQALVFRVDKDDVRAMLASLEAKSGRKVEFQDDEARKTRG